MCFADIDFDDVSTAHDRLDTANDFEPRLAISRIISTAIFEAVGAEKVYHYNWREKHTADA